ncbi:MAG: hypothetical protein GC164_01960 [Phycisphaera sp.]|nr:hypothetical protein [Phycisphaera sp.]
MTFNLSTRHTYILLVTALALFTAVGPARAQGDAPDASSPTTEQATAPTPAAEQPATPPSAEDVQKSLMGQVEDNPMLEPETDGNTAHIEPQPTVEIDPKVLGPAPQVNANAGPISPTTVGNNPAGNNNSPQLRRDGEFVISRRGRVIRTSTATQLMFAFDADGEQTPEPPMILMPCQMLQSMEDLVAQRGDRVVFILSGQVYAYRGANYLLPTMMKLAIDKGNIQN